MYTFCNQFIISSNCYRRDSNFDETMYTSLSFQRDDFHVTILKITYNEIRHIRQLYILI